VNPAEVRVDDEPLDHPDGLLLLLNKPLGLVCSHDGREGPAVYDLLPARWRRRNPQVTSIGRLDKDTSGLILLTDQSALVHRLTSPKHKVVKTYEATLEQAVPPAAMKRLVSLFASGTLVLPEEKTPCAPAALRWIDSTHAELDLVEGRYHQVRRMFACEGFTVTALHRRSFGHLTLGMLKASEWSELPLNTFDLPPSNP
jgi:16S rRNA pseudouridine516 synthase